MNGSPTSIVYDPTELLRQHDSKNKLEEYYQFLSEENKQLNLVSRETCDTCSCDKDGVSGLEKLAAQSLIPFERVSIGETENYIDIGSGGGFPAIPILLTKNVKQATLMERTKKKVAALRRILLRLDLEANIISQTFEEVSLDPVHDLITLRQVKLTASLFTRICSVLRAGGIFVYYSVPDFDPAGAGIRGESFRYATSVGKFSGSFTFFTKNK
jgi:16S rRNA (guanine527-N7)-methyltransferase